MSYILNYSDTQYENYQETLRGHILNMKIPNVMTPADATGLIAYIDDIYTTVKLDFAILEAERERIENIVRQYERIKAIGKNEDDRKRVASEYLQEFPLSDGSVVDMYEKYRTMIIRHGFLKHAVEVIESKQSKLITISGYMKIDANLARY